MSKILLLQIILIINTIKVTRTKIYESIYIQYIIRTLNKNLNIYMYFLFKENEYLLKYYSPNIQTLTFKDF